MTTADKMHLALIVALFIFSMTILTYGTVYSDELTFNTVIAHDAIDPMVCSQSNIDCDIEDEIRSIADEHGANADYLIELAQCESGLNPLARGDSGQSRGVFQIHHGYHPDVSDDCAFDIRCATEWTINHLQTVRWTCEDYINE